MYPNYITGSLRESCKILIKGFNKEFLQGSLTEHPVHHLVYFSVGICVTSCTGSWQDPDKIPAGSYHRILPQDPETGSCAGSYRILDRILQDDPIGFSVGS